MSRRVVPGQNRSAPRSRPLRLAVQRAVEALESRLLMTADFVYSAAGGPALSATLTNTATDVELVDANTNAVIQSQPLSTFSGNIDVTGSSHDDTLTVILSTGVDDVSIDGGAGDDRVQLLSDLSTGGGDLDVTAEAIAVGPNAVLSTRSVAAGVTDADSGHIDFTGTTITVAAGAQLLAGVSFASVYAAGDITLEADDAPEVGGAAAADLLSPVLSVDRSASITLTAATVDGGTVDIAASAETDARWGDVGVFTDDLADNTVAAVNQLTTLAVSGVSPVAGQYKAATAAATTTLTDTAVTGTGDVSVTAAAAAADASFTAMGINHVLTAASPFQATVGLGKATTTAAVSLAGTTSVTAVGDADVTSDTEAKTEAQSTSVGGNPTSPADSSGLAASLAVAITDQTSTATTGPATRVVSHLGNATVAAHGDDETAAEADAQLFSDGLGGLTVGVALGQADVTTTVNGTVIAEDPQGGTEFTFSGNTTAVDVANDTLTISGIDPTDAFVRGQRFTYVVGAGQTPIGGLTSGQTYLVQDVVATTGDPATGPLTQTIRLSVSPAIHLDASDSAFNAEQTLGKVVITTFDGAAATAGASNDLTIGNAALSDPLRTGDLVTYLGANAPVTVQDATATFARAAGGDTITRTDGGLPWAALGVLAGERVTIANAVGTDNGTFTVRSISPDGDTLTLAQANVVTNGTAAGFTLATTPAAPAPIGNLAPGQQYLVISTGGTSFALADPNSPGTHVKFASAGTGLQGFSVVRDEQTFLPASAVDPDLDTIALPNHGFQTGDPVVYHVDPNLSVTRDLYDYPNGPGSTPVDVGTATVPDAPVDGLTDGRTYFVVRVDADHIRLSTSRTLAFAAAAVDLTSTGAGGQILRNADDFAGVKIAATLDAANGASAGFGLSTTVASLKEATLDTATDADNLADAIAGVPLLITALAAAASSAYSTLPAGGPIPGAALLTGLPLSLAGTFAVNADRHVVQAIVGPAAVVKSGGDLDVTATIDEATQTEVEAETSRSFADEIDPTGVVGQPRSGLELGVAFTYNANANTTRALVAPGAVLDATNALAVTADTAYPVINGDEDGSFDPSGLLALDGLTGLSLFFRSNLGISSDVLNNSVATLVGESGVLEPGSYVVAAGVSLQRYDNEATARIGGGAAVNQDVAYRGPTQSVAVDATNSGTLVTAANQSVLNSVTGDIAEYAEPVIGEGTITDVLGSITNPLGVTGASTAGPAVIVDTVNNTTTAEVQSGTPAARTRVYVGPYGTGLAVDAEDQYTNVDVAQTGGHASSFGVTASVTVGTITDLTAATLGANVAVVGGPVAVTADDATARYGLDGGLLASQKVGVGVAVGVNNVSRTTTATLGSAAAAAAPAAASPLDLSAPADAVSVAAGNHGGIYALGIAGATLLGTGDVTTPKQPATTATTGATVGGSTYGAGAAVEDNRGTDSAAALVQGVRLAAGSLAVTATTDSAYASSVVGGAVGAGVAGTNVGIGGAFSFNDLAGGTTAVVRAADVSLAGAAGTAAVLVRADDETTVSADGGGVGVTIGLGPLAARNLSVGLGVAVNAVNRSAAAHVDASPVRAAAGDVEVAADYRPSIDAVAVGGAGAVSASPGGTLTIAGAGAGSKNVITGGAQAYVTGTAVPGAAGITAGGDLAVTATDAADITADAGGVALALSLIPTGGLSAPLSVAASVAINQITDVTSAFLQDTTVLVAGAVAVAAATTAIIAAETIGGAVSTGSGFSGAGSGNTINDTTAAYVRGGAALPVAAGNAPVRAGAGVTVAATEAAAITADGGGFAIAAAFALRPGAPRLSVGVSAAINTITTVTTADIQDASVAGASVAVTATSDETIEALTMGGAVAAGISSGAAFNFAGAGSENVVTATTSAVVADTNAGGGGGTAVVSTAGDVTVAAADRSAVTANGGAVAIALGVGNGPGINASFGASAAVNGLMPTVTAAVDDASVQSAANASVTATADESIAALTVAGAGAATATGSAFGLSLAAAGTGSGNSITGATTARIDSNAALLAAGDLTVAADDASDIDARAVGGALALTAGTGGAVTVGVAIAQNRISDIDLAYVDGARAVARGDVAVTSTAGGTIDALTVGAAVSVAVGNGSASVAGSGAGAQSVNVIGRTVRAFVQDGSVVQANGTGGVTIAADDAATIDAAAGGGTLSLTGSPSGLAASIAVSDGSATNTVADAVAAFVNGASVTSTRGVAITATAGTTIAATAVAEDTAIAITNPLAGVAVAVAGGSAQANNAIANTVAASVANGATVTAAGDVAVAAVDAASITADVPSVAVAVSLGFGVAASASISNNSVNDSVDAAIGNATVKSTGGGVAVRAESADAVSANLVAVAVSAALGGSGQGAQATTTVGGHTTASVANGGVVSAAGDVDVTAGTTATVAATANGGGAGLLNIGVLLADAEVTQPTRASLDGNANVTAANLNVLTYGLEAGDPARSARSATASVTAGQVGAATGQRASATAGVSGAVTAEVAGGVTINVAGKTKVDAETATTTAAQANGGAAAVLNVQALQATANTTGGTSAAVDAGANVHSGSLDVIATAAKSTDAKTLVVNVSVVGGAGANATATDSADTTATIGAATGPAANVVATGEVTIEAAGTESTTASAVGGAGGLVSGVGLVSDAESRGSTTATLAAGAKVSAGSLAVLASLPTRTVSGVENGGSAVIAGISGLVVKSTANVTGDVAATIGTGAAVVTPATGSISVAAANGNTTATAGATGGSGGLGNVSLFQALATVGTATNPVSTTATVGDGTSLTTGDLTVAATDASASGSNLTAVTVSVVVGVSTANSASNTFTAAAATLGAGAQVTAGGDVAVTATSDDSADGNEAAGGGGGIGIAKATAGSRAVGTTTAGVGQAAGVRAGGSITVGANGLGNAAYTQLVAGSGGLVSVGLTQATSTSTTTVSTAVAPHAVLIAGGDVNVTAVGGGAAVANAQSYGGGAVQVGVAEAVATYTPTVQATLDDFSIVSAGGNVNVASRLATQAAAAPPSDRITAVNTAADTVSFAYPVQTGDAVVYDTTGSPIGGLTDGRQYDVIVVTPGQTVQFGEVFSATSNVDPLTDEIRFAQPVNLKPGDAVQLLPNGGGTILAPGQAGTTYYVRGVYANPDDPNSIDPSAIRLATTRAAALATDASSLKSATSVSNGRITVPNSGFVNGQAVTYRSADAQQFATESVDATYATRTYEDAQGNEQTGPDVKRDANGNAVHTANNTVVIPSHGFNTGDAVTYHNASGSPVGGLVDGRTYYVIKVDDNQVKLADTLAHAQAGTALALRITAGSPASGRQTLSRDLAGLQDQHTYYVVNANASDGSFQLAATRGGSPIAVDNTNRDGNHRFGTLGVDLQQGTGTQSLVIPLTTAGSGTQRLLGPGGIPLVLSAPPANSGTSSATARGGSGGGIDVSVPTATLTVTPAAYTKVNAFVQVTAGGNVNVNAASQTSAASSADTYGGGVLTVGTAHDSTTVRAASTIVTVLPGANLQATGDVTVGATANHTLSASARSDGGGGISARLAQESATLTGTTQVDMYGTLTAGGLLSVNAHVAVTGNSSSETQSYGLGAGANSDQQDDNTGLNVTMPATVNIQAGAALTGDAVSVVARIDSANLDAEAHATAGAPFVAVALANANLSVGLPANVNIRNDPAGDQTVITGTHGVDVSSTVGTVTATHNSRAIAVALIPIPITDDHVDVYTAGNVTADRGALVRAGIRPPTTRLARDGSIPQMALRVNATDSALWQSDVELTASGLAPTLTVDAAGRIVTQNGLTAHVGTVPGTNVPAIVVDAITSVSGQVSFVGGTNGRVDGYYGTFTFDQVYSSINLTNASPLPLVLGNVTTYETDQAGVEPKVTIDVPVNRLGFAVQTIFNTTPITVVSNGVAAGTPGIVLTGTIDDPVGAVTLTTTGSIVSQNFAARQGVIRANQVTLNAGGNVGGTTVGADRVAIDIVETGGRPAVVSVVAGGDLYVGLQALDRNVTIFPNFSTGVLVNDLFQAGGKADIELLGGVDQHVYPDPTPLGIQVFETSRVLSPSSAPSPTKPSTVPRTTIVYNRFRNDTGGGATFGKLVGLYGSGSNPLPVTYCLGSVNAATSINIYKAPAVTSQVSIVSNTDLGTAGVNVSANTNGSVALNETAGDLRVGLVQSTTSDVQLSAAAGSILDVPDNNAAAAGDAAADAVGRNVTLTANAGGIGAAANPFDVDTSASTAGALYATARAAVFVTETNGQMNIGNVKSSAGNVTLEAANGTIVDVDTAPNAHVIGNTLTFKVDATPSNGASVGFFSRPLMVDSSFSGAGGIVVTAAGSVDVTETLGAMNVLSIGGLTATSQAPDVSLTTRDAATNAENINVTGPVRVSEIYFYAGDNFTETAAGPITATTGGVNIQVDRPIGDADTFGATATIAGRISALSLNFTGGLQTDTFNLIPEVLTSGQSVFVDGNAPHYPGDTDTLTFNAQTFTAARTVTNVQTGSGTIAVTGGNSAVRYTEIGEVDVTQYNDPPVNALPPNFTTAATPVVLSTANGNAVSVFDADAGTATIQSSFTTSNGTLALVSTTTPGVTRSGTGTAASPLLLVGSQAAINAALAAGLRVTPTAGFRGTVAVTMVSNDRGNTGTGGPLTDTDTLSITIAAAANRPPVNHLPAGFASSGRPIVLSTANGNAISVTDPDAGAATNFLVTLTVADGTLALTSTAGVTAGGAGTAGSPLTVTGSLAAINAALSTGLAYTPTAGFLGTTTLTVVSNDRGNTGPGGPLTDTDSTTITVQQLNQPPVNALPAPRTTDNVTPVTFAAATGNAFAVADPDVDVTATNYVVTLSVTSGRLSLASVPADVLVAGTGATAAPLVLAGSLSEINLALAAGVTYVPAAGFAGAVTLTMVSNDGGNTGLPGPLTDTDALRLTVAQVLNRPPVNALPANVVTGQTTVVFSSAAGNAISVADPDAGAATNFQVTLTPGVGTVSLTNGRGVTVSGAGTAASPLLLTGTLAAVNTALAAGVQFAAPAGYTGTTALTVRSNDNGNTGAGGAKTDTDALSIRIAANANQPPVNTLPADFATSQASLVLSAGNGNAISVADPDAGAATNFQVTLTLADGTLSVPAAAGVSVAGVGSPSSPLLLTGQRAAINAALAAGLVVTPTAGFLGATTLTVVSNDNGNTGVGGAKTDVDVLNITFTEGINQAPVNALPAPITTAATTIVLSAAQGTGLSVSDVDAGNGNDFSVTLSVPTGTLQLATRANLSVAGDGTPGNPLRLVGVLSDIDAALALGVTLTVPAGFVGTDPLTVVSNDAGHTGLGGPMSDTDLLPITFVAGGPVNQPPVNLLPNPTVTGVTPVDFSSALGNPIAVTDPDAGAAANFRVTLTPGVGTLSLTGSRAGVTVAGAGTAASPLALTGTLAAIDAALAAGLRFAPPANFTGSTGILVVSNDNGNTGSGGAKTDADTLSVTVLPNANQPPVNHLPGPVTTPLSTPVVLSTANGNGLSVTDPDAGGATISVTLSIPDGALALLNAAGVTAAGDGTVASPLVLTGSQSAIDAALAAGLRFTPTSGFVGTTLLKVYANDNGNAGVGGPLSDTDYLPITTVVPPALSPPPQVAAVYADSTAWSPVFRDYVDGGFADPSAQGYPVPQGPSQAQTLPWVNVNRLRVTFTQDVGASLSLADVSVTPAPGWTALGVPVGTVPNLIGLAYDASTLTATLLFDGVFPAAVVDLTIASAGVTDAAGQALDGEWVNNVTTGTSGNGQAGGDFSFRLFVLPGDTVDQAATPTAARTVNATDAQRVRDTQNGLVDPAYGAIGYDPRADLDGSGTINATDSQYGRDQQNAVEFPSAAAGPIRPVSAPPVSVTPVTGSTGVIGVASPAAVAATDRPSTTPTAAKPPATTPTAWHGRWRRLPRAVVSGVMTVFTNLI